MSQVAEVASFLQQLEENGGRRADVRERRAEILPFSTHYTIHLKLINVLSHSYQLDFLSLAAAQGDG